MKSFAQSGLIYLHDVWDHTCNKMKSENVILQTLRDKRNWIAELHILRKALQQYNERINTNKASRSQVIRFEKLNLCEGTDGKLCDRILKLKQIKLQVTSNLYCLHLLFK